MSSGSASSIIDKVFSDYKNLKLKFVNEDYWNTLKLTYVRTVEDVINLCRHDPNSISSVRILEVGAFAGIVSTALRRIGFNVTALDLPLFINDEVLKTHYVHEGIHTAIANLTELPIPLPDQGFDLIVCCEVLEHLNCNCLPVLREFHRLLKTNGSLYLATPNQTNIVKRLLLLRGKSIHEPVERLEWQLDRKCAFSIGLHWREFTATELRQLLKMTGFLEQNHRYYHYSARSEAAMWRRIMVSSMYFMFPDFLPGQIIIGKKIDKAHCRLSGV